jgi:ABC-type branched-subunit amino acid transport system substrate-binding protein
MPYIFSTAPSDAATGAAMAYYASTKHYRRIALVFDTSQGSQQLLPSLKRAASILGIKVVAQPTLPLGTVSYQSEVQQVLSANPQAILAQLATPQAAGPFFAEVQRAGGGSIPVVGSDVMSDPAIVQAMGATEAQQLVSTTAGLSTGPGHSYFLTKYHKYIGKTITYLAAPFYDGVTVAALAMIAAHSTKPTVFVKYILRVTTPGKGVTNVYNFATGAKLLKEGKKIKYVGVATPMTFNKYHRVSGDYTVVQPSISGQLTTVAQLSGVQLQRLLP